MIVIVGFIVVIGCVLGGFTWAGGHVAALIHPSEVLTIGGAALGAMIIMSPKQVILDVIHGIMGTFKGSPFTKKHYQELLKLCFDIFREARRDGILSLEKHILDPHHSAIFSKYPLIMNNHHVSQFICEGLSSLVEGINHEQLAKRFETEIHIREEEHHAAVGVLSKVSDGLPGFGIVAAVLGIVITMAHIDGPVEEIGHKVGAALVGTFLGILASYGFIAPLASRMEFIGAEESGFYRTIANVLTSYAETNQPKESLESARRGISTVFRPSIAELDAILKDTEKAA